MKIDLKTLEGPLRFDETVAVDPDRIDHDLVSEPMNVRLEGEVRPHDGLFLVSGRSTSTGSVACARCLEKVSWRESEDFSVRLRHPEAASEDVEISLGDDDLDVAFMDGEELDLTELAAEQVLLALPMRLLCDPECAGLCPRCGANRNRPDACRCPPEVDPRWGALADLAREHHEN